MYLEFMTRSVFDTLIIAVILIGSALAFVRLYRDFTRPLPPIDDAHYPVTNPPQWSDDDTQPTDHLNNSININPHEE